MMFGTRGCRWVIGQTGVIKCMLIHTFYNPCLSDHPPTPPSKRMVVKHHVDVR